MAYSAWRNDIAAGVSADPQRRREARLWNMEHDQRIVKGVGVLKRMLGHRHTSSPTPNPGEAAEATLEGVFKRIFGHLRRWLRLLPARTSTPPPSDVWTYISAEELAKYHEDVFFDPDAGQRTARLLKPLKAKESATGFEPATDFLWVTFEENGRRPPTDDPTAVRREIGLPHFPENEHIYRAPLTVRSDQSSFIPTVIDARAGPAWQPAPPDADRGVTRDLTTGADRWPELLVDTSEYLALKPRIELVSPAGTADKARPVTIDYMAGR